jgi:hypothetical protein
LIIAACTRMAEVIITSSVNDAPADFAYLNISGLLKSGCY